MIMITIMVAGGRASGGVHWFADACHRNSPPSSQLLSQVSSPSQVPQPTCFWKSSQAGILSILLPPPIIIITLSMRSNPICTILSISKVGSL